MALYKVLVGYNTDNGFVDAGATVELDETAAQALIDAGNLGPVDEVGDEAAPAAETPATPETPAENPGEGSASTGAEAPVADAPSTAEGAVPEAPAADSAANGAANENVA